MAEQQPVIGRCCAHKDAGGLEALRNEHDDGGRAASITKLLSLLLGFQTCALRRGTHTCVVSLRVGPIVFSFFSF